jgi:hypothetical protein
MVAKRSEVCTVFARSEAGIVGLNPTRGIDVWYVYVFILCLGRGLAMSWTLVQGVLPSVKRSKWEKNKQTNLNTVKYKWNKVSK